jgi:hypothetical protein
VLKKGKRTHSRKGQVKTISANLSSRDAQCHHGSELLNMDNGDEERSAISPVQLLSIMNNILTTSS